MILELFIHIAFAISTDCLNVINLARGLNMQNLHSDVMDSINNNCCTARGIQCNDVGKVTRIDWNSMGLDGVLNGTALPSGLIDLVLYRNGGIHGQIPDTWPINLNIIDVDNNELYGDISTLPRTMKYVYLGWPDAPGNHFTGSLVLNQPFNLYINDNWITDVQVIDPTELLGCDLSNNPLLGNPNIISLVNKCGQNGLYAASLLPVTISTTKSRFSIMFSISSRFSTFISSTRITSSLAMYKFATESSSKSIVSYSSINSPTATSVVSSDPTATSTSPMTQKYATSSFSAISTTVNMHDVHDEIPITETSAFSKEPGLYFTSVAQYPSNTYETTDQSNEPIISPYGILSLLSGLVLLCLFTFIASKMLKNPKINSKFGRRNSFGTLMTVQTKGTTRTK